jgi:hypothetical protein
MARLFDISKIKTGIACFRDVLSFNKPQYPNSQTTLRASCSARVTVGYQKRIGVEERVREPRQKSMTASFRLPTPTTSTGSVGRGAPSASARTPGARRRRLRGDGARRRVEASGGGSGSTTRPPPRTEADMDWTRPATRGLDGGGFEGV